MSQDSAVQDQLIEAQVAEIKAGNADFGYFAPGDAGVAAAIVGGKMKITHEHKGQPLDTVTLYDQETGEPRPGVLVNMLSKVLRKRKEDGRPALGINPPAGVSYVGGSTLCLFHPDHPNRAAYDRIGLAGKVCKSAHLASDFDARRHAENRHPHWYRIAKENEDRIAKEAEVERQNQLMGAMLRLAEGKAAPVADTAIHWCKVDGCSRFFDSPHGLSIHEGRDHKGGA